MAIFTGIRDWSLMRHVNRELLGNVITQQAAFYQFKLEETKVNIFIQNFLKFLLLRAPDYQYYNLFLLNYTYLI